MENKEVAVKEKEQAVQTITWTKEQVELIKRTVAKGTTDDELALFLYIAKRTGLDPFARQIYCVKRWDSEQEKMVMTPQTGIDGFRLIADRTGRYAPGTITWETNKDNPQDLAATATIKKFVGGEWHEISATAFFQEYAQHKKDGSLTRMWTKMPRLMIGKCAEALVLRKAFPAELSGVYTSDEMMQADTETQSTDKPATVPPEKKPALKPGTDNKHPVRAMLIESLKRVCKNSTAEMQTWLKEASKQELGQELSSLNGLTEEQAAPLLDRIIAAEKAEQAEYPNADPEIV